MKYLDGTPTVTTTVYSAHWPTVAQTDTLRGVLVAELRSMAADPEQAAVWWTRVDPVVVLLAAHLPRMCTVRRLQKQPETLLIYEQDSPAAPTIRLEFRGHGAVEYAIEVKRLLGVMMRHVQRQNEDSQ